MKICFFLLQSLQGRIADAEQALAAERSAVAQNHSDSGAELSRLQEENQVRSV